MENQIDKNFKEQLNLLNTINYETYCTDTLPSCY